MKSLSDSALTPSAAGCKCEGNAVARSCQSLFHDTPFQMKGPLSNGQLCRSRGGPKYLGAKYQPRILDHELQQISQEYPLISLLFSWYLDFIFMKKFIRLFSNNCRKELDWLILETLLVIDDAIL